MKTSELTGAALDWAVAKCEGIALILAPFTGAKNFVLLGQNMKPTASTYEPSKYWAQGGPIIEREKIELVPSINGHFWYAESLDRKARVEKQPTPLIAAMRCYCASKLGDEVEIPEELK